MATDLIAPTHGWRARLQLLKYTRLSPMLNSYDLSFGVTIIFSSVQFSKGICIAQLSRMSHCAPAAREPVRFKVTPEARVGDVLVA